MTKHEITENMHKAIKNIYIIDVEKLQQRIAELEKENERMNSILEQTNGVTNEYKNSLLKLEDQLEAAVNRNEKLKEELKTALTIIAFAVVTAALITIPAIYLVIHTKR